MRLATLVSLLASVAALATGCSAAIDEVAQAATKTGAAPTARFTITISQATPAGQPLVITGRGAFDGSRRLHLSVDLSRVPSSPGSMELVLAGRVMYLRMPSLESRLPAGVHWVSLDLGRLAARAGLDLDTLMRYGGSDPRQSLAALAGLADLHEGGEDTVRGVQTTRYRGTLDVRKALESLPEQPGGARLAERALEAAGVGEIPTEVWVDRDGWIRRVRQTVAPTLGGVGLPASTEVELFAFGEPVHVALPARGDTVDLSRLGG
jgi:hypothetical protein